MLLWSFYQRVFIAGWAVLGCYSRLLCMVSPPSRSDTRQCRDRRQQELGTRRVAQMGEVEAAEFDGLSWGKVLKLDGLEGSRHPTLMACVADWVS